jgi:hypothetical protein
MSFITPLVNNVFGFNFPKLSGAIFLQEECTTFLDRRNIYFSYHEVVEIDNYLIVISVQGKHYIMALYNIDNKISYFLYINMERKVFADCAIKMENNGLTRKYFDNKLNVGSYLMLLNKNRVPIDSAFFQWKFMLNSFLSDEKHTFACNLKAYRMKDDVIKYKLVSSTNCY